LIESRTTIFIHAQRGQRVSVPEGTCPFGDDPFM